MAVQFICYTYHRMLCAFTGMWYNYINKTKNPDTGANLSKKVFCMNKNQTNASQDVGEETEEVIDTQDQPQKTSEVPDEKETTLGDLLDNESEEDGSQTVPVKDNKGEEVPLYALISMKEEIKDLKRQLASKNITKSEANESLDELLNSYEVDPSFVKDLLKIAKDEARKELQPEIDKVKASEKTKNVQSSLKKMLASAVDKNSEYADIINENVILTLANDPKNRNKTMSQLIDETYGKVLERGSKSIESHSSVRNKSDEPDFNNMTEAEETAVYNDPELKKKYAKHQAKLAQDLL